MGESSKQTHRKQQYSGLYMNIDGLNDSKIGEIEHCFTKQNFDLTPAVCVYDRGNNIKYVMKGIVVLMTIMIVNIIMIGIEFGIVIAVVIMVAMVSECVCDCNCNDYDCGCSSDCD